VNTGGRREVVFEFPLAETLTVSFQRYPCPAAGVVSALPRSWGALPVAETGPLELAVPVPEGEAVWLGLRATAEAPGSAPTSGGSRWWPTWTPAVRQMP
jgi:hypothetical protein